MTKKQIKDVLSRAAWTFFQAFAASLIVLLPGILAAPNLQAGRALLTAALVSSVSAGLSALKGYVKSTL